MGPLLVLSSRSIFIILIAVVCNFVKVSRESKNGGLCAFCLIFFLLILSFYSLQYRHILTHYFLLSIFHTFLCFDSYFNNFPATLRWLSQELLSELHFHIPQFCRKKLLLMQKFMQCFYDFITSVSPVKSLKPCFWKLFEMKRLERILQC